MDSVLSLLGNIATMIFFSFKDITEEDIKKNIEYLKQYKWFQEFLNNEKYSKLVNDNADVRKVIGSINTQKMSIPIIIKSNKRELKENLGNNLNFTHMDTLLE
ncbi:hypothetical protein OPHB3_1507 [Oceanobacillus picturae]|uniref:Uncharacterized protein n=1 Tax=Oceanobacillus picturae TaxID=171693 RepID=A0A0U9H4M8_9BACI|nr:hypothetical protein [Oceanobacillus picturae]GAQ17582.1 hypothetical protein OPHB3_1507 [Oceanobacillus picturae]